MSERNARVLWIAAAPPARGPALHAAGFDLLHLDAHAGSADWVRSLVHDAVVIEATGAAQAAALIAALRAATAAPLLLLGRPADEALQSLFYELGVDDQLDAGVGATLLAARLAALFRRWGTNVARTSVAVLGDLRVDRLARRAAWRGSTIALATSELDLLFELAQRQGRAVPREAFGRRGHPRTLDVQVSRLRRRLAAAGVAGLELRAVSGYGYRLALA